MHGIRTLDFNELPLFRDHLRRLDREDRRLRFGTAVDESVIDRYVRGIDVARDRVLGVFDAGGRLIGAVHVAPGEDDGCEFAFSVDAEWRGRSIGTQLMERAVLWARNRGLRHAHVYCLAENLPMRHLARKAGMELTHAPGEAEGVMPLLPATPLSLLRELSAERWALWEQSRRQRRGPLALLPQVAT